MSGNIFNEKLITESYQGKGKVEFLKGFDIGDLNIKGKALVFSDSSFFKFNMLGKMESEDLCGKTLTLKGAAKGKNIKATEITLSGSFIFNNIEGENILLKGGDCHINLVNGKNIEIFGSTHEEKENFDVDSIFREAFFQKIGKFINFDNIKKHVNTEDSYIYIDKIIGERIVLQNVVANYVEGSDIKILSGCEIKELKENKKCHRLDKQDKK